MSAFDPLDLGVTDRRVIGINEVFQGVSLETARDLQRNRKPLLFAQYAAWNAFRPS